MALDNEYEKIEPKAVKKKICPILSSGDAQAYTRCMEEGCAWWDRNAVECSITSGMISLRLIKDYGAGA